MSERSEPDEWTGALRGDGTPSLARVVGLGVVGGIGLLTFGVHLAHLWVGSNDAYAWLLGTAIPMCLSVVLLVMAIRAHRGHSAGVVVRIGAWCFVGGVVMAAVGVISIAYQLANSVAMTDVLVVLTNHVTVGAILGALIGSYDGQRHQRGRELRAEHARAQQLSNRLTILNRVFRHDIRNAVNVILGHANHVREGRGDRVRSTEQISEKARELESMSECARRLEQLLDPGRSTTSPIDIAPSLREKASTLADESDIAVETEIPPSVGVCSTPMIEEAVDELLHNAVEHNDADRPHLVIGVRSAGGDDDPVVVRIEDNGPGIPEEEIQVLERGHETALHHSSGLGLWFVHWIVDASDGQVVLENKEPRGSVAEIHLPASDADGRGDVDVPSPSTREFDRATSAANDR